MNARPTPLPGLLELARYESGARAKGVKSVKLSSNENPFGPSPRAISAMKRATETLHRYPPADHAPLREAIAETHGLKAELISCGAGSDELLSALAKGYAGPGHEAIYTYHGFSMYPIVIRSAGATAVIAPERERHVDVEAILSAITPQTRLIFIANPANPSGTMLSAKTLAELADRVPSHIILVLDGAYAEFAPEYDGGAKLVETHSNVVMTRSFSKLYGLGGLRLGFAYAPPEITDILERLRGPFNIGNIQIEGGIAALEDKEWTERCLQKILEGRTRMLSGLRALGLSVDESSTNFVTPRFANALEADDAEKCLRESGLIVRKLKGYHMPDALRITIGDEESNKRVLDCLAGWQQGKLS